MMTVVIAMMLQMETDVIERGRIEVTGGWR